MVLKLKPSDLILSLIWSKVTILNHTSYSSEYMQMVIYDHSCEISTNNIPKSCIILCNSIWKFQWNLSQLIEIVIWHIWHILLLQPFMGSNNTQGWKIGHKHLNLDYSLVVKYLLTGSTYNLHIYDCQIVKFFRFDILLILQGYFLKINVLTVYYRHARMSVGITIWKKVICINVQCHLMTLIFLALTLIGDDEKRWQTKCYKF